MLNPPDFEADQDFSQFGLQMGNDEEGHLLVNAEKNDEFDPRIASDVEGLLFLGRLTHDFDLYGHPITIRTLTRGERLAAALYVREYEDSLGLADALQTAYVSQCLVTVDNRPLTVALAQVDTPDERLARNWQIVTKWHDAVIEAIYTEYQRLLVRQNLAFRELEGKSTASRLTPAP